MLVTKSSSRPTGPEVASSLNAKYAEGVLTAVLNQRHRLQQVSNVELQTDRNTTNIIKHCVYKVTQKKVGEYFNLWVGDQFINATSLVEQLQKTTPSPDMEGVHISVDLWKYYHSARWKQVLCQSLLTAVAFYRIGKYS